jgi:hypothetical protein
MSLWISLSLLCSGHALASPDGGVSPSPPPPPGFRLEGQPQLEIPFGDADSYRKTVDHFLALHDQMQELRDDFSRSVQDVLAKVSVDELSKKRRCNDADIAAPYARAFALGQQYLRSGRDLERAFTQVRDLDSLGETQGLTPDYRFKVKRVLELYKQLLADYREMKVAFHDQLAGEIKYRGCDPAELIARAEQAGKAQLPPEPVPEPKPARSKPPATEDNEARPAATVTFFVDNVRCKEPLRVYLDQMPLGRVEAQTKGGFRAKAGPHDLCLLPQADKKTCGAPGTVRRAYLHEGFAISLRCGAK